LGSETLDDTIGSVKVQLAPKTNVWANLAGVEVLTNVVVDYLVPTKKTTVLEIGCGTGLTSLLLASVSLNNFYYLIILYLSIISNIISNIIDII
jgi:tRNA/tmRNA/rRNA uracil-C5-methylase (TrmA/RlmC/RlmD family)